MGSERDNEAKLLNYRQIAALKLIVEEGSDATDASSLGEALKKETNKQQREDANLGDYADNPRKIQDPDDVVKSIPKRVDMLLTDLRLLDSAGYLSEGSLDKEDYELPESINSLPKLGDKASKITGHLIQYVDKNADEVAPRVASNFIEDTLYRESSPIERVLYASQIENVTTDIIIGSGRELETSDIEDGMVESMEEELPGYFGLVKEDIEESIDDDVISLFRLAAVLHSEGYDEWYRIPDRIENHFDDRMIAKKLKIGDILERDVSRLSSKEYNSMSVVELINNISGKTTISELAGSLSGKGMRPNKETYEICLYLECSGENRVEEWDEREGPPILTISGERNGWHNNRVSLTAYGELLQSSIAHESDETFLRIEGVSSELTDDVLKELGNQGILHYPESKK
jgi:hypothetical protein